MAINEENAAVKPIRVFIVCSGLGRVRRGYESFTQECFDTLCESPELNITLFKGGGSSSRNEKVLWHLPRDGKAACFLGKILRRGGYFVEQITFGVALIPRIARLKPQVIFFSDANIGSVLSRWRRLTRNPYRLLFSNGSPFPPPFPQWDHVHQVNGPHYQAALNIGEPASKHSLVPYGIQIKRGDLPTSHKEKLELRKRLNLPLDRPIIISVAALNKNPKRLDYLINEVANLPSPRPFLLMLGQQEAETPIILDIASKKLNPQDYKISTVSPQEIPDYYRASDLFALTSLSEGFGRVFVEAMSQGLPCLAHDHEVSRYVLGEYGYFADFTVEGNLTNLIRDVLANDAGDAMKQERHLDAYGRFSWEQLKHQYIEMFQRVVTKS